MIASSLRRVSSLFVAATLCATTLGSTASAFAATPVFSAGVAYAVAPAKAPAAPATDGRTIGMMRFTGSPAATELRATLEPSFDDAGYPVKGLALDIREAGKKAKCKAAAESDECLTTIGKWLVSNPKTAVDFIVFASVTEAPGNRAKVVVFDVAQNKRVIDVETTFNPGDLILPIVLPQRLIAAVEEYKTPPEPATAEELAIIDALDEPDKTPEELAAEKKAIADAELAAAAALQDQVINTDDIEADLKDDFEAFCRNEPRRKRASKEDPKDLRPACKRGPFWGYWQPRAWVALGLTAGSALGTAALYTTALIGRGPYGKAVDAVDAYNAAVSPADPRRDPNAANDGDQSYAALATEVSRTGSIVRRRAIVGDVLLGTTVLLGGVLAIIIYQDRTDAKRFLKEEKSIKAISDVRVGPMLSRETQGLGLNFRF